MGSKDYEKQCQDLLLQTLNERKKKLLILFDNFGELFLDNLPDKETHRLREVLMNCTDMRIVAASAIVLVTNNVTPSGFGFVFCNSISTIILSLRDFTA